MPHDSLPSPRGCSGCHSQALAGLPPIRMAFQPIVALIPGGTAIFAYEALVRGAQGEPAGHVLAQVGPDNRYAFDQRCRVQAIEQAAALGLGGTEASLSINFMPNAVYEPRACIRSTLEAARRVSLPRERLIFEFTEGEAMADPAHLLNILSTYRATGFRTAIDDFGSGWSGLNLLAMFQPDIVKLDMGLLRGADMDAARRIILRHTVAMCRDLSIQVVAEGVETEGELQVLRELGVTLFQGYLFARPGFDALPILSSPPG